MKKTSECDSKKNTEKENVPEKEIKKKVETTRYITMTFPMTVGLTLKRLCPPHFTSLFLGLNESTCQIRKNVFYFTSKPLFIYEKIQF